MLELGKKAKDIVTGFEGILVGKASYIYGCDQYCVVPPAKDGKLEDSKWFDDGRLRIIGEGILAEEVQVKKPGGPQLDAPMGKY